MTGAGFLDARNPRPQKRRMQNDAAGLAFRFAVREDAAALVAALEEAYRGEASAGRWDSESHLLRGPRTSLAEVSDLIADPDSHFVFAERDGALCACALIQKSAHVDGRSGVEGVAYFGMFAVARRGVGVGDSVLAECERRVRALWSATSLSMTVISLREALIGWYERRGYRKTGLRIAFPFDETTGETRRDFDLVELAKPLA
jgi:ribosomal protein S18 acetylase RimI-like enzyme